MGQDGGLPTLMGERVTLRPTCEDDVGPLVVILSEPEVRHWWGATDAAAIRAQMETQTCWTVLAGDEVAGWMHAHEERDEEYPSVAFDIALGERARGRGLGQEALRLAIRHYIRAGHHRFTIDPAAENERAIRSYAAAGFKPVGVLRAYERVGDGEWRDGLLMDLLASEFTETA